MRKLKDLAIESDQGNGIGWCWCLLKEGMQGFPMNQQLGELAKK